MMFLAKSYFPVQILLIFGLFSFLVAEDNVPVTLKGAPTVETDFAKGARRMPENGQGV